MPTVISLLNCVRRPVGRGDGLRAREQGADHRRRARRIVGPDPVDHHVPAMNRSFTNVLFGAFGQVQAAGAAGEAKTAKSGTPRDAADLLENAGTRRHRARLRHGGRAGAAPRPRDLRSADQARHRREVRDPSGRRPHAGPHERAARRGGDALRRARRDGRHQPRPPADRRRRWSSAPTTSSIRRRGTTRRARSTACRSSTPTRPRRASRSSGR